MSELTRDTASTSAPWTETQANCSRIRTPKRKTLEAQHPCRGQRRFDGGRMICHVYVKIYQKTAWIMLWNNIFKILRNRYRFMAKTAELVQRFPTSSPAPHRPPHTGLTSPYPRSPSGVYICYRWGVYTDTSKSPPIPGAPADSPSRAGSVGAHVCLVTGLQPYSVTQSVLPALKPARLHLFVSPDPKQGKPLNFASQVCFLQEVIQFESCRRQCFHTGFFHLGIST